MSGDVASEVLALARQGLGVRAIERRLNGRLKKSRIAEIVAAAKTAGPAPATASPKAVKPSRASTPGAAPRPARATRPTAPPAPSGAPPVASGTADELAAVAEAASAALAAVGSDGRETDCALLERVHARLTELIQAELKERAPDWRTVTNATRLTLEIAKTLAAIRPPPAVRPEDDPANLDAAEAFLKRFDVLVEAAEQRAARGEAPPA